MGLIKKFFDLLLGPDPASVPVPPRPADWKLTLKDLYAEVEAGKRTSLGRPELDWAVEYELSLVPPGYRFPRHGDVYESMEDQDVEFTTHWKAPYTGGGMGRLLKGERVRVEMMPAEKQLAVAATPLDYEKLEERMVPPEIRMDPKYQGFQVHLETMVINQKFELVEETPHP